MKKIVFIITAILLSATLMQSCKPSDENVQKSVDAVLMASAPGVSASVKDQVATLSGTVDSEEARSEAQRAVSSIKNVKSVVNNIQVRAQAPAPVVNPDDTITTTVKSSLNAAGFNNVNVMVKDGVVTLKGDVKRSDLQKIMQIANESNPKQVVNELKVK